MPNMAPGGTPIQALVIGEGKVSSHVVEELSKNSRFNITWAGKEIESSDYARNEESGVVKLVELSSRASPMTINDLVETHKPDIIFLCQRGSEAGTGETIASENLEREMLGSMVDSERGNAPIITVSLEQ